MTLTNGQMVIGSTGATPVAGTITSTDGSLTVSTGAGTLNLAVAGGTTVGKTITGNSGGALSPTAGNWNIVGAGSITTSGSGSTLTAQLTGLTNHAVLVGAGTDTITSLTVGTTGQLLVGSTGADPAFGSSANADFTFTSSTAGGTRTLTVTNTDNTNAASHALLQTTTGGASGGDPFHTFTVTGATSWSTGIDNSASDAYVIAASTALGTTNVMSMATGGGVSCVLGNFDTTRSASGADVSITASNTSNTASSNATIYATVAGTSANDARVQYAVSGTTTWTQGIDNSASDAFVLSASTALGTTNVVSASTAGEINYPLQPAFLAYLASTANNKTGNGTTYTIGTDALTEVFDQGGDFVTSGTFTAPVTGRYMLAAGVGFTGLGAAAATNVQVNLNTSNRIYTVQLQSPATTDYGLVNSRLADMDAADTSTVSVTINGLGADTADISGTNANTSFSGFLAC